MSKEICQNVGKSDVCEKRRIAGASYTYILGGSSEEQKTNHIVENKRNQKISSSPFPVEAKRSKAGARLALIRRLITHRDKGIPYSAINAYFKKEFDDIGASESMSSSFIADILIYDPRNDPAKDYPEVLAALNASSANLDWLQFWDIIEGLTWD